MADVTIAVTRYEEPDQLARDALESLARQQDIAADVLFLDQRHDPVFAGDVKDLSGPAVRFSVRPIARHSLSFARNEAIRAAAGDIVLFMDCDAVADPRWAAGLVRALDQDGVGVAGSRIVPRWARPPPLMARARTVWEQYSLLDLGPGLQEVTRVVGAGFGIDRRRLGEDARFDATLGRRDGRLFSGEDSDICLRARARGLRVVYNGDALIKHQITAARITHRWIFKRLFYAGANRATLGGAPNASHGLSTWDALLLPAIAIPYIAGYLWARLGRSARN
jgi:GT2 family glycosyltransferase